MFSSNCVTLCLQFLNEVQVHKEKWGRVLSCVGLMTHIQERNDSAKGVILSGVYFFHNKSSYALVIGIVRRTLTVLFCSWHFKGEKKKNRNRVTWPWSYHMTRSVSTPLVLAGLKSRTQVVVQPVAAAALPDTLCTQSQETFKSSPDCTYGWSINQTNAGEKADRANENKE